MAEILQGTLTVTIRKILAAFIGYRDNDKEKSQQKADLTMAKERRKA